MKYRIVKFFTKKVTVQLTISVNDSDKPGVLDEQNIEEQQPDEASDSDSARYPQRFRNSPAYMSDYATVDVQEGNNMSNIDYCYRVAVYPKTYNAAMSSPDASCLKLSAIEEKCVHLKKMTHLLWRNCQKVTQL